MNEYLIQLTVGCVIVLAVAFGIDAYADYRLRKSQRD